MRILVLGLASCAVAGSDPSGGDGDAAPPDTTVIVAAIADGAPMGNARVIAHNADGATIDSATTDAAGLVRIEVAPFITVLTPLTDETSSFQIMTLAGATAGETVRFASAAPRPQADVMFRLTAPADPGAASYRVVSTCGDGGSFVAPATGALDLVVTLARCGVPADLAIVSLDAGNQAAKAIWRMGVTIAPNTVVSVGGVYAPVARSTIAYSHVPATISGLATERALVTSRGMLASEARDVLAMAGAATVALALPPTPDTTEVITTDATAGSSAIARHAMVTWGPMAPARAIDLGALLADYSEPPVYDSIARQVTWAEREGATADLVIATLYTVRGNAGWTWRIAVPRAETPTITLPRLPEDLAALAPTADSQIVELTSIAGRGTDLGPIALALDEPVTFAATSGELVRQALYFSTERAYHGKPCVVSSESSSCSRPRAVMTATSTSFPTRRNSWTHRTTSTHPRPVLSR